jgi:acetyl esterase/lipase
MTGQSAGRSRLSQPERSARMRQKLLEATVQCLDELGYAATSTTEVVARAGVSRGALAHHFASKTELRGLPPVFLVIPKCDINAEQNYIMEEKLKAAEVPVKATVYEGATHSFLEAMSISKVANEALDDMAGWLVQTLKIAAPARVA